MVAFDFLRNFVTNLKITKLSNINNTSVKAVPMFFCILGGAATLFMTFEFKRDPKVSTVKLTHTEKRFVSFASVEHDGQLFMTPKDFLESVIEAQPRRRLKRNILNQKDLEKIKNATPRLKKASPILFRSIRDDGIISYADYLFLISVLIKPQSNFKIAFELFDTDNNKKIDKNEFLVMEKIFSNVGKNKNPTTYKNSISGQFTNYHHRKNFVDTTLLIHFFGPNGKNQLNFEDFKRFMLHLQTEVLELEFNEFSKGLPTISELDFAEILLRGSTLDNETLDLYLNRFIDRNKENKGITFDEFYHFFQFLNKLDDFAVALRIYTLTDLLVSKKQFRRAFKLCSGVNLTQHLVNIVFVIFDHDEDGLLNYKEFIVIMKYRLHRDFKSHGKKQVWKAFKFCVNQERKTPIYKNENLVEICNNYYYLI